MGFLWPLQVLHGPIIECAAHTLAGTTNGEQEVLDMSKSVGGMERKRVSYVVL